MQQKVPFFDNVKENIAMEATLRKNKEKLQEKLHKFDAKQMKNE